jgi:hypothetical protein
VTYKMPHTKKAEHLPFPKHMEMAPMASLGSSQLFTLLAVISVRDDDDDRLSGCASWSATKKLN